MEEWGNNPCDEYKNSQTKANFNNVYEHTMYRVIDNALWRFFILDLSQKGNKIRNKVWLTYKDACESVKENALVSKLWIFLIVPAIVFSILRPTICQINLLHYLEDNIEQLSPNDVQPSSIRSIKLELLIIPRCQTVSKALDKSINMALLINFLSNALEILFTMSKSWLVVDELGRKPKCSAHMILFLSKWSSNFMCMSFSSALDTQLNKGIGR